jgi:hypothetical protein
VSRGDVDIVIGVGNTDRVPRTDALQKETDAMLTDTSALAMGGR